MSRAQRLLNLIQILRTHRAPVSGSELAQELGISLRTLYRDIGTLQEQGANIEGEPGLGYVLRPGFTLPPLMFTEDEIEALVLGSRWVADRGDQRLSAAAISARTKVAAVLPDDLRRSLDDNGLLVIPRQSATNDALDLADVREAIRSQRKLTINYRDLKESDSTRTVWPFALGYFDHFRVMVAWCELREGFRHFRTDRIVQCEATDQRYPRHRQALLKEWRKSETGAHQARITTDRN